MSRFALFSRQPVRVGRRFARRGFTLIEASMVTVIVGVGVVGMLNLLAAGTMSNAAGTELTTAVNLANNIHEITLGLTFNDPQQPTQWATREASLAAYDDLLDLDGLTFSPPLDVRRQPLAEYASWSQAITVQTVADDQVSATGTKDAREPMARVTVTVTHHGQQVHQTSWLAVAPSPQ